MREADKDQEQRMPATLLHVIASPGGEAWSMAFASTSARITMPAPPPAGVSSTVR